jgi:hypothetical protein
MGSARKAQVRAVTEQVTSAVKSAGTLVVAALAVACVALAVSVTTLIFAMKARPAHAG